MESSTVDPAHPPAKRPRSESGELPLPAAKAVKTHSNHLQINYLARQYNENIPLVSSDDTLPSILRLISEYDGVLHRHESIAGNLGACPLGPILIKRFERLFDGPPKVLKSHGKEGTTVTWLDVVEFARNKPEQFNLEKTRNGVRVCQFYTKQSRVEISEEDYVLIASGMPQKLIPPQPIMEDEEKELGALEILEKNLSQIIQLADQGMRISNYCYHSYSLLSVSARARQLNHRLKNRKSAIISRRETEAAMGSHNGPRSATPPSWGESTNGGAAALDQNRNGGHTPHSPPSGFVAVNSRQSIHGESNESATEGASQLVFPHSNTDNVTIINGTSIKGASPTTRAELMKKFFTTADRNARGWNPDDDARRSPGNAPRPASSSRPKPKSSESNDYPALYSPSTSAVPIPNTPSSLLPHLKPAQAEKDDGGPYKAEMVGRMEQLHRGERVLPPCDRCRRLHMDCLKNLTACQGCTKKHAKCSWKEVNEEELRAGRIESTGMDHEDDLHDDDQMRETPDPEPSRESFANERSTAEITETESEPDHHRERKQPINESIEHHPIEVDVQPQQQTNGNGRECEKETMRSTEHRVRSMEPQQRRTLDLADEADDADAAIARAIATVSPPAASAT
jgi:hypothetical protein